MRVKRHKEDLDIVHSPYIKYIVQSKLQNYLFSSKCLLVWYGGFLKGWDYG